MGGIPSNVAGNRPKPVFTLSGAQQKVVVIDGGGSGGSGGGGGGSSSKTSKTSKTSKAVTKWETVTATSLMPHFATFPPSPQQDWERHDGGHIHIATHPHPYASAGGEESFEDLSVNEKTDKDTPAVADLPSFVSYVPPPLYTLPRKKNP
jgi:hypothetical protein